VLCRWQAGVRAFLSLIPLLVWLAAPPPSTFAMGQTVAGQRLAASQAIESGPATAAAFPETETGSSSSTSSGPTEAIPAAPSALAKRLAGRVDAFERGPDGSLEAVFGVPLADAAAVFFPVSHDRALPQDYIPPDLVRTLGHPLRALVVGEFQAMFQAAGRDGAYPVVVSGYRSAEYQAGVFERAVWRQLASEPSIEREEAERRAARFVAPPGHSQHQLGTTADLSSWEIGYAIRPTFRETVAGRWLAEHAWEYGFILPYTAAAETRTGYVAEPWHLRWVGQPLATLLWEEGYFDSSYPTADDWLLALEEVLVSH
jgi:zinc D-Ala-D-Ala carboxypeptidase